MCPDEGSVKPLKWEKRVDLPAPLFPMIIPIVIILAVLIGTVVVLVQRIKEINNYGFLGIFTGGIKATAAGVGAAIFFSLIVGLIFRAHAKA